MRDTIAATLPLIPFWRLRPGDRIVIRNRTGVYRVRLRTIGYSAGRWYVVGDSPRGFCHRAWASNIIRIVRSAPSHPAGRMRRHNKRSYQ